MKKLVLFDIDGTLIDPGAAGRISLTKTFEEILLIKNAFQGIRMAGKTDIQIIKEGLSFHAVSVHSGLLRSILRSYLKNLSVEIHNDRKHILPGVLDFLKELKKTEGCWMGLLTGNIRKGARIKLEAFGLNDYFSVGAFGDDHEERNQLLPIAVERFRKMTQINISYPECIVVGDTPSDVACSKPYGALSIVVSTGTYPYESLLRTGADWVLKDLSRTKEFIEAIKREDSLKLPG